MSMAAFSLQLLRDTSVATDSKGVFRHRVTQISVWYHSYYSHNVPTVQTLAASYRAIDASAVPHGSLCL